MIGAVSVRVTRESIDPVGPGEESQGQGQDCGHLQQQLKDGDYLSLLVILVATPC